MESISGKIAAVTGGTRGIGRAIVERLLQEGTAVAFCGQTKASVERTSSELEGKGKTFGCAADVSRPDGARAFFQAVDGAFGGVDILVHNAGVGVFRKVGEMTAEEWHRNIDLNLNGAFYCAHEALARFRSRGGGYIVNISSLAGKNPFTTGAAYNASKFGLNGFTEALMLDHRYDNVRVTTIMPGSVATKFAGGPSDRSGDTGWMIQPEDVAEAVALVLRMPARTMISSIDMRPARPKK